MAIQQINFYHHEERLVTVGNSDDWYVMEYGGRREIFEIADNEQLIGCELDHCKDYFRGVTWLKWKITA